MLNLCISSIYYSFIAVTQFGPTAARRAFPLFDENFFKATFSVTLMRKKDWTALSNTELMTTEVRWVRILLRKERK